MRPESVEPVVPVRGCRLVVQPAEIVGIACHVSKDTAQRSLSVLEITSGRPGTGAVERVNLAQALIKQLPPDRHAEHNDKNQSWKG